MRPVDVVILACVWLAVRCGGPGPGSRLAALGRSRPTTSARARRAGRQGPPREPRRGAGRFGRGPGGSGAVPAPVLLDLIAEVLASGAPVPRAVAAVGEALDAVGDPGAAALLDLAATLRAGTIDPGPALPEDGRRPGSAYLRGAPDDRRGRRGAAFGLVGRLTEALDLALVTGSSPVSLIRAAAQEERRAGAARAAQAARRLGVMVLLPTGLCLLPAFVLLTVVPLALGLALGGSRP